ncbi:hypothetical protein CVT26_014838 [Gymnopilus dilepis]|uniref:BTB domain-containing protein n=1 Tax=Gymnopilus dilepis TaxID=231916 RepID=A0A409XWW9_9AGAR|nr:hypothetical protein CVT26_014838 [Gymnopilus dilepis]
MPFPPHSQIDHEPNSLAGQSNTVTDSTEATLDFVVGGSSTTLTGSSSRSAARKRLRRDSDARSRDRSGKMSKSSHSEPDGDTDTEMAIESLMSSQSSIAESPVSTSGPASSSTLVDIEDKSQASTLASSLAFRLKPAYKHDETYYFEDGSCVLLIQDTLFNVHRTILSKDSSSFGTMFSLPQGSMEIEGRSDENPIILTGDTPDEFRHFLWALYALPPELRIITGANANLNHLIDIARVSNKYSFKSLETWALDAIQEYVNRKPSPILTGVPPLSSIAPASALSSSAFTHAGSISLLSDPSSIRLNLTTPKPRTQAETSALLSSLIRLAQLCQHQPLLLTMISLLRQLMTSSVHYAYLAMTLADELDLRALRGAAYLEVMSKAVVVRKVAVNVLKPPSASDGSLVQTDGGNDEQIEGQENQVRARPLAGTLDASGRLIITRPQQLRLLAGYYRLTSTWELLRQTPPPFDHSPACSATWHQQGCTQSFLEFWKEKTRSEAVMGLGPADLLGRLKTVQREYERWGSATYMHHDCRMIAKRAIMDLLKRVEEALPDYFAEAGGTESDDDGILGMP